MPRVAESAVLDGERACGAGSEFSVEEPARRASPVVIAAYGEPDRTMLVSNQSRWDSA